MRYNLYCQDYTEYGRSVSNTLSTQLANHLLMPLGLDAAYELGPELLLANSNLLNRVALAFESL